MGSPSHSLAGFSLDIVDRDAVVTATVEARHAVLWVGTMTRDCDVIGSVIAEDGDEVWGRGRDTPAASLHPTHYYPHMSSYNV